MEERKQEYKRLPVEDDGVGADAVYAPHRARRKAEINRASLLFGVLLSEGESGIRGAVVSFRRLLFFERSLMEALTER